MSDPLVTTTVNASPVESPMQPSFQVFIAEVRLMLDGVRKDVQAGNELFGEKLKNLSENTARQFELLTKADDHNKANVDVKLEALDRRIKENAENIAVKPADRQKLEALIDKLQDANAKQDERIERLERRDEVRSNVQKVLLGGLFAAWGALVPLGIAILNHAPPHLH